MSVGRTVHSNIARSLACSVHHPGVLLWRGVEVNVAARTLAELPNPEPVLDLGCAEGVITGLLFPNVPVIGVDPARSAATIAKENASSLLPILGDARRLPIAAERIGLVFSNSVIEHILGLDLLLSEVRRVLRPGGLFVFTVPTARLTSSYTLPWLLNGTPLRAIGRAYGRLRNRQLAHHNLLDETQWRSALERQGFEIERYLPYLPGWAVRAWDVSAAVGWLLRPFIGGKRAHRTIARVMRFLRPIMVALVDQALADLDASPSDRTCAALVVASKPGRAERSLPQPAVGAR